MKPGQIVTRTDGPWYKLNIVITRNQSQRIHGALFSHTNQHLWDNFDWDRTSLKPIRIV